MKNEQATYWGNTQFNMKLYKDKKHVWGNLLLCFNLFLFQKHAFFAWVDLMCCLPYINVMCTIANYPYSGRNSVENVGNCYKVSDELFNVLIELLAKSICHKCFYFPFLGLQSLEKVIIVASKPESGLKDISGIRNR